MTRRENTVAFLTGATGFIGGRLAGALHARGCRLRCLVRAPERAGPLAGMGAELIVGDVTDEAALAKGMRGVDYAYHMAALYDIGPVDATAMQHANVEGTRAFLNVLRQETARQAVYVSTTAALAPARPGEVADAQTVLGPPYPTAYQRTKAAAHRLALEAQREGLPLVIVCPANVYGPGDEGPNGRLLMDVLQHRLPGLPLSPSTFSYVHVDDVVSGLIAAAERGAPGATYVLGGEALTLTEYVKRIASLAGTWVSPLRFPQLLVHVTGIALDAATRITGVRMPVSREGAALVAAGTHWVHSSARAARELGYHARAVAEGLPETVRAAQTQRTR